MTCARHDVYGVLHDQAGPGTTESAKPLIIAKQESKAIKEQQHNDEGS
jgi:hypothetical protein